MHEGGVPGCARCRFYTFGAGWIRSHGTVQDPRKSERTMLVWVQERPARFGGQWGLGCFFCAQAALGAQSRAKPPGWSVASASTQTSPVRAKKRARPGCQFSGEALTVLLTKRKRFF